MHRRLVENCRIPLDGSTIEYRKAIRIIEKIEYSKKKNKKKIRIFDLIFRLQNENVTMGVERCFGRVGEGVGGHSFAIRAISSR